jgi:hypothetical protein
MRRAANFNPEWGYLAPAPSFIRSARLVLVATAVGASAGGAVVFSLVDRPVAEQSVAARTLVQTPLASEPATVSGPVVTQLQTESQHAQPQADAPSAVRRQAAVVPAANAGVSGLAAGESGTTSTVQRAPGAVALAEAPAVTDAPPVPAVNEAVAAAPEAAAAQTQKVPNKKPRVAWRPAPRYDAQRYYMYAPRYYGAQPYDQRYVQMERNSFGW